jgi:hypothetical protein
MMPKLGSPPAEVFAVARGPGCAEAWVLTDRANTATIRLYAAAGSPEAPTDPVMFTFKLDTGTAPGGPGGVAGAADAEPVAADATTAASHRPR